MILNNFGYSKMKDTMSRYSISGWPVSSSLLLMVCSLMSVSKYGFVYWKIFVIVFYTDLMTSLDLQESHIAAGSG